MTVLSNYRYYHVIIDYVAGVESMRLIRVKFEGILMDEYFYELIIVTFKYMSTLIVPLSVFSLFFDLFNFNYVFFKFNF